MKAFIEILIEFNIVNDIVDFLNEIIQDVFLLKMRKNFVTNHFVEIMKEMSDNSNIDFVRLMFKLMDKHFELDEVLIDSSLNLLTNAFSSFKNIDFVISDQVLFLESFEEYFEEGEWFDIFVDIHIPDLRSVDKSGRSKASLLYHRNLDEFHVFLNIEYSSDDDDD